MSDSLAPLLQALQFSPDNVPLRAHVVRELLKARRYEELSLAEPLLDTDERAVGLLGIARFEQSRGALERARSRYEEAIRMDSKLIDEGLEAELAPQGAMKISLEAVGSPELQASDFVPERKRIGFDEIGGMEALKEQLRMNIIYPMQRPEIFETYGKKVGGGILLYGPPGCGKTHLARAVAGELGASFFSVGLNEILDMYIGNSEKNLANLFQSARSKAPSVLFIDEVDSLGTKRGGNTSPYLKNMTTQFLTEMDGVNANNEKLLVLGATNEPWAVDTALRRPGRFDRVLFVPPPDLPAREEILKLHARNKNVGGGVLWSALAAKMEHFSGADIAQVVDEAVERAVTDALRTGNMREVTGNDFQEALKGRKATTMEWLRRSANYVKFANKDGFYDDLEEFLRKAKIR